MKVQISELVALTGMTWRTVTKRLAADKIEKIETKNGKDWWDSGTCLATLYAPKTGTTMKDSLTSQRSRLAAEQADRLAMENEIARGKYAPIPILEQSLAKASATVAASLDAVIPAVKRRIPKLTIDELDIIKAEITKARNLAAKFQLTEKDIDEEEEDQAGDVEPSPRKRARAAKIPRALKRKRVGR